MLEKQMLDSVIYCLFVLVGLLYFSILSHLLPLNLLLKLENKLTFILELSLNSLLQHIICEIILRYEISLTLAPLNCLFRILVVSCPALKSIKWNVMLARGCTFLKPDFSFILHLMWQEWLNRTLAAVHGIICNSNMWRNVDSM